MLSPNEAICELQKKIGKSGKLAFLSAFVSGLLTHMAILTTDVPNHDGLASMYFDQNMITSGRWFLGMACGPSSFHNLPWLIGILALLYISLAAVIVRKILKIENPLLVVFMSVILTTFPSLASNFAYVFTMDGYMLGMLLCVMSVWAVEINHKWGFILGAVFLAFGMGCYQAYVCVAMLLCFYKVAEILIEGNSVREKVKGFLSYAGMGVLGVALYYVALKLLLAIQGKELDTYQGISGMSSGNGLGLLGTVKMMYTDFFKFTFGSKVVFPNCFAVAGIALLTVLAAWAFLGIVKKEGLLKKPLFYLFVIVFCLALPCVMNAILLISADVNYHVLMRYQWGFLIVILISVMDRGFSEDKLEAMALWLGTAALLATSLSYVVTDNVAYSNLQKKYEKTYGYCLRLADRIEQTEGYYEGIPIAMVGVVGNESYPTTDITQDVTADLLSIGGDYLLYKSENYEQFFRYYLGISFNMVSSDEVVNFYDEDFYAEMHSFPAADSVLLHDGVIYVKTENQR